MAPCQGGPSAKTFGCVCTGRARVEGCARERRDPRRAPVEDREVVIRPEENPVRISAEALLLFRDVRWDSHTDLSWEKVVDDDDHHQAIA